MPIGISDAAAYLSVGLVWVITWASFGSCFALLSLSSIMMCLRILIVLFPVIHFNWKMHA